MNRFLIIPLIILCFNDLYAQEYEYVDSLESVQINIKADFDSTYSPQSISVARGITMSSDIWNWYS